jgi:uncharacterized protein (DUF1697 family)
MKKYVALFRGINVGGNNQVEMAKLRGIFESLGFLNVSTYINSGNVLFESDGDDEQGMVIEKAFEKFFGFAVHVVVRDADNIQFIYKAVPSEWENNTEQKTDVLFVWDDFDTKTTLDLIVTNKEVDTLRYISGAIIWNVNKKRYNESGMKKFSGSTVYKHMTARNINTVRKLAELMA